MPVLAPAAPAPIPSSPSMIIAQPSESSNEKIVPMKAGESGILSNNIPIVSLDVDVINDAVAASLATSLLGHVLFLKSQVPLPVMQLSRMPSTKSTARALKQRHDLLTSFDTLTSHLNTTFTALSSALAKAMMRSNLPLDAPAEAVPVKQACARVYLAIFVGSNTASAKSKVIYAIEGLEIKAIGARDDLKDYNSDRKPHAKEEDGEDEDEDGEDEDEDEEEDEEDDGDEEDGVNDDDEESEEDEGGSEEDSEVDTDNEAEGAESDDLAPSPPRSRAPSPEPLSSPSHAEQQRALQAAERLLSRTLAAADAEGNGMSADIAPTQTHILLRAPRRFVHPAWVPRQNISTSLESTLDEFLEESGIPHAGPQSGIRKKAQKKGKAVEGVWVTSRGGLDMEVGKDGAGVHSSDDEWDEMIWWSWDGKISGFSEW